MSEWKPGPPPERNRYYIVEYAMEGEARTGFAFGRLAFASDKCVRLDHQAPIGMMMMPLERQWILHHIEVPDPPLHPVPRRTKKLTKTSAPYG